MNTMPFVRPRHTNTTALRLERLLWMINAFDDLQMERYRRLPTTGDGVLILPPMPVWRMCNGEPTQITIDGILWCSGISRWRVLATTRPAMPIIFPHWYSADECYSCREALEEELK